jgi:hypothetical protein
MFLPVEQIKLTGVLGQITERGNRCDRSGPKTEQLPEEIGKTEFPPATWGKIALLKLLVSGLLECSHYPANSIVSMTSG